MPNPKICVGENCEGQALREYWAKAYGDDRIDNETYDEWLKWIESRKDRWIETINGKN